MNYTNYLIEKIKDFILNEPKLSSIIKEKNIKKTYVENEENEYPIITVKTIENNQYNFTRGGKCVIEDVSWQVNVYSIDSILNGNSESADYICDYIKYMIDEFLTTQNNIRRTMISDSKPIDYTNNVYFSEMRFSSRYNLLNNNFIRR